MLKIFDSDVCYEEYCKLEFDAGKEWESICLDDESLDAPISYYTIRNLNYAQRSIGRRITQSSRSTILKLFIQTIQIQNMPN